MRSTRGALVAYAVLLTLLSCAIPVLGYAGVRTVLDSRDGEVVDPVLDPTQPGYQALVSSSPTFALLHEDPTGRLVGAAVLALAGETGGGSVLLIPAATLAEVPELGTFTLEYMHALNGAEGTAGLIEWILAMAVDDVATIDDAGWAELVEPLAEIRVTNPDELRMPGEAVSFAAGELSLGPAEVGRYLAFLAPIESPLNRLMRQEAVWEALLDAVSDDPGLLSIGGEQDRGLARFLPSIAAGTYRLEVLPLLPELVTADPASTAMLHADREAVAQLVPQLVPFPAGAKPGDRPLVKLLDRSGDHQRLAPAARLVAQAGGQVVVIGNDESFGSEPTEVIYGDRAMREDAERIAEALGADSVSYIVEIDDSADIIVLLGSDRFPPT